MPSDRSCRSDRISRRREPPLWRLGSERVSVPDERAGDGEVQEKQCSGSRRHPRHSLPRARLLAQEPKGRYLTRQKF